MSIWTSSTLRPNSLFKYFPPSCECQSRPTALKGANESRVRQRNLPGCKRNTLLEIQSREPFRERGVHVNKLSKNQFLISEPLQWLSYAKKHTFKIVQAAFDILWVLFVYKLRFWKNLDLKIGGEQQIASGQQNRGGRCLLLSSDFQIKISFQIRSFYGRVT